MEIALAAPATSTAPARVLVVDDDPSMRLLCAISLQREGHVVVEAPDVPTALTHARSEAPDLILTDVSMPELDGFELAEELRRDARTRTIPVVFISGETEPANEARARALGALAYLTKPFDPAALAAVVESALAFEL